MMPEVSDAAIRSDVKVLPALYFDKVFGITKEDQAKQTKVAYTRSAYTRALTGVQNSGVLPQSRFIP